MINTLEQFVSAEDNQLIVEEIPKSVYNALGHDFVDEILEGIEELNELALDGEIIITENETIYETDDTSFNVQGGVNKVVYKWYGRVRYFSTSSANTFAGVAKKVGNGAATVGAVAAYFSAGTTALFGGLTTIYFHGLSDAVTKRNSGHNCGIILHVTWASVYWTARQ
ncbi:hypothetical protein SAMN05421736_10199 [Evansella caseinilytica]|uniref:Uncharacterized protein n=1 Tax=Evansella caseinilytica TaxID=1503961 RepID=A0A1H3GAF0_9BACI|nr:hypothetical protein [Evansella caseinilytica]SDX99474.1 hypothetical protein SAMN05421736_10199 [Evansella caseinilytica]